MNLSEKRIVAAAEMDIVVEVIEGNGGFDSEKGVENELVYFVIAAEEFDTGTFIFEFILGSI